MSGAGIIADFAARTMRDGVPQEVLNAARLHFLDAIGVGIAASTVADNATWSQAATSGGASLLGGGAAEAGAAAMINGALIHALEYDDTHIGSVVHGSAVAAPLALAVSQFCAASGRDLIRAYIITWEVAIRIGLAGPGAFQEKGFQVTSVGGAIGAAAAAAQILGLDRQQTICAIGIAGGQASGTLAFLADGAMSKALNPGWAARTGIEAARLALAGMTGPATVLESRFGVMSNFGHGASQLDDNLSNLGNDWFLREAAFKLYPCCHYIHPFLETVEQIMAEGVTAADIVDLTAFVPPPAAPLVCEPWERRQEPASGYDGKWGLAYCMALMFLHGRVDVASFETPPLADVISLARKMTWQPMQNHGFPKRFAAQIDVRTAQGTVSAGVPQVRGAPDRPVDRSDIVAKFTGNASRRLDAARVQQLMDIILNIDMMADTEDLQGLLA
jgi:2-methylcitrate dehydratase PrpD